MHKEYKEAFAAGVWDDADPGPWLGRAIVYKTQVSSINQSFWVYLTPFTKVNLHKDQNDDGLSVCFPVGRYGGGEMIIPILGAKFL